jgi:hypothetical protein
VRGNVEPVEIFRTGFGLLQEPGILAEILEVF